MKEIKLQDDGLKICTKCKRKLPIINFSKSTRMKCGYSCWCKDCIREVASTFETSIGYRFRRWSLNTIKTHKIKFNVNITIDELTTIAESTIYCPICGIKLNWERGNKGKRPRKNNPTLDRIDNGSEMNITNVEIICHRCNTLKSDETYEELLAYCENVIKHRRVK